jgi:cytochrome c oxidase assembly protein subunit 11
MAKSELAKQNRSLTRQLWMFAAGSFAFGFAMVPLYDVLCDITGYGSKRSLVEASTLKSKTDMNRLVTVEFISSMPTVGEWEFRPEQSSLQVHPGQLYEATFYAKSLISHAVTAQAVPSIAPQQATQYFRKTDCFCFTPQQFEANQARELKVRFFVDPSLPGNIDRVTLGYAMFDVTKTNG